jgi:hypothetical protein
MKPILFGFDDGMREGPVYGGRIFERTDRIVKYKALFACRDLWGSIK